MCGGSIFTAWSLPCQIKNCCRRNQPSDPSTYDIECKLFGDDTQATDHMITTYQQLSNGSHFKSRSRSCHRWILYALRYIPLSMYMLLFFPVLVLFLTMILCLYVIKEPIRILYGFVLLRCRCIRKLDGYFNATPYTKLFTVDDHSYIAKEASLEEQRRFDLYIMPVVMFNISTHVFWWLCRYLAGFFEANLIEDELIIYYLHLLGTSASGFVYEYNAESLVEMQCI